MKRSIVYLWLIIMLAACGSNTVTEEVSFEDEVVILNDSEFDTISSISVNDLAGQTEKTSLDEIQKEYVGKTFPSTLILEAQQVLYEMVECTEDVSDEDGTYFLWLKEMGSENYVMTMEELCETFPEVKENKENFLDVYDAYAFVSGEEDCLGIFRIGEEDSTNKFLFCIDSGSSYGSCDIYIVEYRDEKFVELTSFETQNNGWGKVIKYDNGFYYVFLQYNYNLKNYDGIRIYKLENEVEKNNILIRYFPEKYEWENVEKNNEYNKDALDLYLESIKEEVVQEKYIEKGQVDNEKEYFVGDEVKAVDFPLMEEYEDYYYIDFANIGIPIYMKKSIYLPSDKRSSMYFKASFYLYDFETKEIREIEGLQTVQGNSNQLVQLWFKEIDEKVYTFALYHLENYDYMLQVFLMEGTEITSIRKELISPICSFYLEEGQIYQFLE